MAIFDVDLLEPTRPLTADSTDWTADSTEITADAISSPVVDASDAVVNANFIAAEIYEPIHAGITADTTTVTADSTEWTADGGPLLGASDFTDAEVISAELPAWGGAYYPPLKPFPVEGVGYGILPRLEGEAFGEVLPPAAADEGDDVDDDLIVAMMLLLDEAA